MTFPGGNQLLALDLAFRLKNVPFPEAGLYRFYCLAAQGDSWQALRGQIAELRVLDRRAVV